MSKPGHKIKALALRRRGKSVKEIAHRLAVSRGTVSIWVRDITLTTQQTKHLHARMVQAGHRGRLLGAQMNREKKLRNIATAKNNAKQNMGKVSKRDLFMLGLGIYWGEGVKSSSSALAVVNSDPAIILTALRWFTVCLGITRDRFHPRIYINASHRDRAEELLEFWSKTLHLPKNQFANTVFINTRNKKVYENRNTYYGVVTLRVSRGTEVRYQILALLECLRNEILPV